MEDKMFNIGKIVNTHGIRGEVKVLRISDFEERFSVGKTVYLVRDAENPIKLTIAGHRIHKNFDLIFFEDLDNINKVEHFKGAHLKIHENQLTDLGEEEYYYHEIIGCEVFTDNEEKIGTIKEILSPGANDVWVVQQPKGKDLLIPYIEDVIKVVDIDAKKVFINPMEGLLD
ncbi:ribosome maturation factor RimM [Virgibacillus sp. DJP39]|uniref:ribosome maturation factor RimM n=1 Tax=Virgibacillus sp. DJP39 TaxID=3409790 RepID=UPI003BB611E2